MSVTPKPAAPPTADQIADMADAGDRISEYFTNDGSLSVMRKARNRVRDFCLYALISALFIGSALYAAVTDVQWGLFMRWFDIALLTFFLFGFFLEASRQLWKRRTFWYWTAFFFCVHSAAFGFYGIRAANWTGSTLGLTFMIESAFLAAFRTWIYRSFDEK